MKIDHVAPQIDYVAPQHVRDVVAALGRTEDVRFSPSNRRLAVAEYWNNKISVFEVFFADFQRSKSITLTDVAEISSTYIHGLHGLDFIDDETLLVANRDGEVCIFALPIGATGRHKLAPMAVIRSDNISTPGSVAVSKNEKGLYEALICNNYLHSVTRHLLDSGAAYSPKNSEVLLKKWLDIPDGISLNKEMQWIAVSNHSTHSVLLYENKPSLNESSDPDGILRRTNYPHGLRFTSDDRFILVANAGSPYVNIYEKNGSGWRGVHNPLLSLRVLSHEAFLRGRSGRQDGGPKGIDITTAMNIFVTTCESQPLAFFDFEGVLKGKHSGSNLQTEENSHLAVKRELYRGQMTAATMTAVRWLLKNVPGLRWIQKMIVDTIFK